MAIPEVTFDIQDFALGIVPQNTANVSVKLGMTAAGVPGQLTFYNSAQQLQADHLAGPAMEAAAHALSVAGGPVGVMKVPLPVGAFGGVGTFVRTGTGTGTIAGTAAPFKKILLRIAVGGVLGTAEYQISLDNGVSYGPNILTPVSTTAGIDGTLTIATFGVGTHVAGEVHTFNTDGTVNQSPAVGPSISPASSPVDDYQCKILITKSGAATVGEFQVSLDGGDTYGPITQIASGGKYIVPDAGFFVQFTGTFTIEDYYSAATTSVPYTVTELNTAFTALLADPRTWGHVHVVGAASNMAGSATLFTAIATQMAAAQSGFRFAFALMELPDVTDATIIASTAFNALADRRVSVAAGYEELYSTVSGRTYKRSFAWPASARVALAPFGEDKAFVQRGPMPGIVSLYRNEAATPNLDSIRYTTARTLIGAQGFYATNVQMFAPAGSDFTLSQNRMVMDVACSTARSAILPYLNGSLRVNATTGRILEIDAKQIEAKVNSQLKAVLVATGNASSSSVSINRDANILSTGVLLVEVRVVPLAYMKQISVNIGFENPSLAAA